MRQPAWAIAVIGMLLVSGESSAQTFQHALPLGLNAGKTSQITVNGAGLAGAKTLWTSFPAKIEPTPNTKPADNFAAFQVTPGPNAPLGVHGWRVVSDSGVSDLRLCVIDDLPVITKSGNSSSPALAQKVPLPVAIDGLNQAEQMDYFAFDVAANQRVAFEVVGARLGVDFDPMVRILRKDGTEVLSHDNDEGLGFDLRFEHVFAQAGEYLIELRDTRYQGANAPYHLRIGDFPIGRIPFPAGGRRGETLTAVLDGAKPADALAISASLPTDPLADETLIAVRGGNGSAWSTLALDDVPQAIDQEPNDTLAEGQPVMWPVTLNGRFHKRDDVDFFRFKIAKGQVLLIQADTRRLATPVDLYVRVLDRNGAQLAVSDDNGLEDAQFTFTAPADGDYTIAVEDLHHRGGPNQIYRLRVAAPPQDVLLWAGADRLVLPRGGSAHLLINGQRTGPASPVKINCSEAFRLHGSSTTLSAADSRTTWTLSADPDAPLGLQTLALVGERAGLAPRAVDFATAIRPQIGNLPFAPSTVTRWLPVLVVPQAPFRLSAKLSTPIFGRFVPNGCTVVVEKDAGFDDAVTLALANLPEDVKVDVKPIAKGQGQITLQFQSGPKTPIGKFPVFVQGTAPYQGRTVPVMAPILEITTGPAYAVTLPTETKIARKGKTKIVVEAQRHPGYAGPINVTLNGLPAGVTVGGIAIPQGQAKVEVELSANESAALGPANLAGAATATINGQNESFALSPVKLLVTEK